MATAEQHFTLVRISKSSWAAVYTGRVEADGNDDTREPESTTLRGSTPAAGRMFAETAARTSFFVRFPRVRTLLIALTLVAVTATVVAFVGATFEMEFLRLGGMVTQ